MASRKFFSQLVGLPLRWMMFMAGIGLASLLVMPNAFLPQGKLKIHNLCFARSKSAFEMNNIQRGDVTL